MGLSTTCLSVPVNMLQSQKYTSTCSHTSWRPMAQEQSLEINLNSLTSELPALEHASEQDMLSPILPETCC